MKYILSQEEYDDLKNQIDKARTDAENTINKLCTIIADGVPQHDWRTKSSVKGLPPSPPKPWECIHTVRIAAEKEGDFSDDWYCDCCQVQEICTQRQHYSQ